MIKSRKIKWVEYVAHMGEMRNAYEVSVKTLKRKDHSEDLGVDGKVH
jgi:hypothetical protein